MMYAFTILISSLKELQNGDPARPLRAAEIGVCLGETSEKILREIPALTLLMIDKWSEEPADSPYRQSDPDGRKPQQQLNEEKKLATNRTAFACDRRQIIVERSLEAAKLVADESLDLVFIDADHSYDAILADIRAWFPKVRKGGILSGHDFKIRNVSRAVRYWVAKNGLLLEISNRCWIVRIPNAR